MSKESVIAITLQNPLLVLHGICIWIANACLCYYNTHVTQGYKCHEGLWIYIGLQRLMFMSIFLQKHTYCKIYDNFVNIENYYRLLKSNAGCFNFAHHYLVSVFCVYYLMRVLY